MPTDIGVDQDAVAAALRAMPPDEGEPFAEEPQPAPEGSAPAAPNAAEPAGSASAETHEGEGKNAEGDGSPEDKGKPPPETIPYARFQEVIRQKNELQERQKEREEDLARRGEELGRVRAAAILEQIAAQHPSLAPILRGEQPAQPEAPLPEDPTQRELAVLRKETEANRKWREDLDKKEMIRDIEDRVETAIGKHEIVQRWRTKSDSLRDLVEGTIVHRILANPSADPAKVVDDVASALREVEEGVKASYKGAKTAPAKTVPPGVGAGAPQPPGQPRKVLSLDRPGEMSRAVAGALEQLGQE